mmetsp:Transcript_40894/g.101650  ORF Transcript_40894/g.101650 Transcript_40894/m.101650 type:complete len:334 (-) Transcript_40894:278-1279(-)
MARAARSPVRVRTDVSVPSGIRARKGYIIVDSVQDSRTGDVLAVVQLEKFAHPMLVQSCHLLTDDKQTKVTKRIPNACAVALVAVGMMAAICGPGVYVLRRLVEHELILKRENSFVPWGMQINRSNHVVKVFDGSPASEAGLFVGNAIVSVHDEAVTEVANAAALMRQHPIALKIRLGILRLGTQTVISKTIHWVDYVNMQFQSFSDLLSDKRREWKINRQVMFKVFRFHHVEDYFQEQFRSLNNFSSEMWHLACLGIRKCTETLLLGTQGFVGIFLSLLCLSVLLVIVKGVALCGIILGALLCLSGIGFIIGLPMMIVSSIVWTCLEGASKK